MISDGSETNLKVLENFTLCTLQLVKEEAMRTWLKHNHKNSDIFTLTPKDSFTPLDTSKPKDFVMVYRQFCSRIIAKRIKSNLSPTSWKVLFGKLKTLLELD